MKMRESLKPTSRQNRIVFPGEYASDKPIPCGDATITKVVKGIGFGIPFRLRGMAPAGLNGLGKRKRRFIPRGNG